MMASVVSADQERPGRARTRLEVRLARGAADGAQQGTVKIISRILWYLSK